MTTAFYIPNAECTQLGYTSWLLAQQELNSCLTRIAVTSFRHSRQDTSI